MQIHTTMLAALALGAALGTPAHAASAVWNRPMITPAAALQAAQAAQANCEKNGWQVSVAVTDASGTEVVLLRDRFAGWHTVQAATAKARTAAGWRSDTAELARRVLPPEAPEHAIIGMPGLLFMGGGLPIEAAGQVIGAIGVAGAPGADNDAVCAKAGIAAIESELEF